MPVILRLEDFGLELKRDAVSYIIEFVYRGEVNIPGERLTDVCQVKLERIKKVLYDMNDIAGGPHPWCGRNGAPTRTGPSSSLQTQHVKGSPANC